MEDEHIEQKMFRDLHARIEFWARESDATLMQVIGILEELKVCLREQHMTLMDEMEDDDE